MDIHRTPDRLIMSVPGASPGDTRILAQEALKHARLLAPKLTGSGARAMTAIWGAGWFGIRFPLKQMWFQEAGIRPFTMKSLQGKTIPMWITDPTGRERAKNPKAKTRVTASGKTQVLIFRKVSKIGSTKSVQTPRGIEQRPLSYPGAPGRIGLREAGNPYTTPGKMAGAIARRNVGVRWRHPGLQRQGFIRESLTRSAIHHGYEPGPIRDQFGRYR